MTSKNIFWDFKFRVCVPKEDAYAGKNSPCYKSKHCGSERQCVKFKREPKETPGWLHIFYGTISLRFQFVSSGNVIQCVTTNHIVISMEEVKSVFMKDCYGKKDFHHLGKSTKLND